MRQSQSKYAHFRYWPLTATQSVRESHHKDVEIGLSEWLPRSMGLFAHATVVGSPLSPIPLADYIGVLMWSELQEAFDEQHYCPTTIDASVLNYDVDESIALAMGLDRRKSFDEETGIWTVHVTLVGDPTCFAAITNSSRHLRCSHSAQLAQCTADKVNDYLFIRPDGKVGVRASFLRLWTDGSKVIKVTVKPVEILVQYDSSESRRKRTDAAYQRKHGKATFWDREEQAQFERPYCDRCFRRNPESLMVCQAQKKPGCCVARHVACASTPPTGRWFCSLQCGNNVRISLSTASMADSTREDHEMSIDGGEDDDCMDDDDERTVYSRSSRASTAILSSSDSVASRRSRPPSMAGSKRARAFSLPKNAAKPLSGSTPEGRQKVVDALERWAVIIRKTGALQSPDIIDVADEGTVTRFVAALDQALAVIKGCCASGEHLRALAALGNTHSVAAIVKNFDSAVSFLDARYGWRELSKFVKKVWSQRYFEAIEGRQMDSTSVNRAVWCGAPLCDGCFRCAVGVSASTVRRISQRGPEQGSTRSTHSAGGSSKPSRLVEDLLAWAQINGQSLPTADGLSKGVTKHFVMPTRTVADTLIEFNQAMCVKRLDPTFKISRSTFSRTIEKLKRNFGISLNIRVWKKLAKCEVCTKAALMVKAARNSNNLALIHRAETIQNNHHAEWKEQRDWFNDRKNNALRNPSEEIVFTLDGMDQSKTSLPHYFRDTNATKNGEFLNVRIVGAFAFGGCIPCMGFITLDNVKGKGANASATIMERMIDLQFESQDPTLWEPLESINDSREILSFDMDAVERYRAQVASFAQAEHPDEALVEDRPVIDDGPVRMEIDGESESKEQDESKMVSKHHVTHGQ